MTEYELTTCDNETLLYIGTTNDNAEDRVRAMQILEQRKAAAAELARAPELAAENARLRSLLEMVTKALKEAREAIK